MSAFCTVRSDALFSILVATKPGVSFSTTNPLTWSSSTSRAQMIVRSAKVALPIQRLAPLSTHSSPVRLAVVRIPPATSDPPSGSVRPNAPISSIRCMAGSQRSCCSGDPHSTIVPIARPLCTPMKVAIDGSTLAISSPTNPVSSWLAAGASLSP